MLIIERTFWFIQMAIAVVIVGVIVLMIVRLIADAMDLNPFGWASRTIRRLTDWTCHARARWVARRSVWIQSLLRW